MWHNHTLYTCTKGADISYAFHYVHDFCRFNMEVNTSQTDVDRSISYAEVKADRRKYLNYTNKPCEMQTFPNTTSNMRSKGKILRQCVPQTAELG
jgi:hypothetical protein